MTSGVSLNVGYFHRAWVNFAVVDDRAVGPDGYDTFQLAVPDDPRLPDAGGLITLVDLKPEAIHVLDQITTSANNFGGESESWDGVDVTIDARIDNLLVQGGFSTGRTGRDNCDQLRLVPESQGNTPLEFCDAGDNWVTQVKLLGSLSLPGDIQVAATLQNQPGAERQARVTYSTTAIAAALGRSSTGSSRTVNVIQPGTVFGDRFSQFDLRFTKLLSLGGASRLRAMFDLFNVFNANTAAFEEPGFGSLLWNPQVTMPGRLAKFAFQIDF